MTDKTIIDKGFLDEDLCGVGAQYALFKHSFFRDESVTKNVNTLSGTEFYADTLTESFLSFLTPHVEKLTGMSLVPSYSTLRNYFPGESLDKNTETNGCDITAKICLGYSYNGVSDDYKWGIFLDGQFVEQEVGDLIVYNNEVERWKEPLLSSQNSYCCEFTAYWNDANSDKPPFDGRDSLGMRKIIK